MNSEMDHTSPILMINDFLITQCGHSSDDVAQFMQDIEVPESAKGLWTVATRLKRQILPIMSGVDDCVIRQFTQRAIPICNSLEQSFDSFPEIVGFRFEPAKTTGRVRPGFLSDHPLYGTLWVGCDVAAADVQYDCLRAHFAAGYFLIRPEAIARPYILRNAAQFCRLIGTVHDDDALNYDTSPPHSSCIPKILQQLPKVWTGTSNYGDRLEKLIAEAERVGAEEGDIVSLYFVADTIRGRLPERRPRGSSKHEPEIDSIERPALIGKGEPLYLPRQASPGENIDMIDHVGHDGDDGPNHSWTGVDDEDILPVEHEVKIRSRKGVLTVDGDRLIHISAGNMADALAAANQMFPFSRVQSSSDDITYLFSTLNRIESVVENREKLESMALAEIIFSTGQSIEQSHAARLMNIGTHNHLWFDMNSGIFGFPPWTPKGHDRPSGPLALPMPVRMKNALSILVKAYGITLGEPLFSIEISTLKIRLKTAFKTISEKFGVTLSLSSVGSDLYRTIVQQRGGDESPAILITCQATHRGYLPATYTEWSAERLLPVFVAATETLHKAEFSLMSLEKAYAGCVAQCGSSFVPTMSKVQTCVTALKDQVRSTQHLPPRRPGIIETHFVYAAYVHCMLSFATGWRPNVLPLPDWRLVDLTTGMCTVSDKDGDDAYHTHLVWLPDVVIQQLRLWEEHLQLLAERLVVINLDSANALLWRDPIKLYGNRQRDKKSWHADPRFLFGLQIDGSRHPIQPTQINEFLQEHIGGKDNGHRHFMRTELTRLGVSDEVVRALLGHWRNGEESFGKFAAMDPWTYRAELARVMPKMLHEMGWRAVKSPFWKQ